MTAPLDRSEAPVRLLLSSSPAVGHLAPLLPVAAAARRAGHAVAVTTPASMAPLVPAGVELLPAGPDLPELFAQIPRLPPRPGPRPQPASPEGIGRFFGWLRAETTADPATEVVSAWAPDVVVSEGLDVVGRLVATRLGLPWVGVSLGPVCSWEVEQAFARELGELGLVPDDAALRLDPWPARLRPPGWHAPGAADPLRATVPETPASAPVGDAIPPGEGPAVLVTLGTIFDEPERMQAVLDATASSGLRVAGACGPRYGPDQLHVDPARVRLHRFGPLGPLLDAVDGVVCHGGAGTVLAALSRGLPLLVLPQGADHPMTASGVEAAGAGIVRDPDTPPEELARLALEVVRSADVRAGARQVADDIAAAPSVESAVARIEQLT